MIKRKTCSCKRKDKTNYKQVSVEDLPVNGNRSLGDEKEYSSPNNNQRGIKAMQ